MGRHFLRQNFPFAWGIGTPSNAWLLGPARVHNSNGMSIGSAVFAGLTTVTERQTDWLTDGVIDRLTDHATRSVTIDRIYVHVVLRCGLITKCRLV